MRWIGGHNQLRSLAQLTLKASYHLAARIPVSRAEFWKLTVSVAGKLVHRVGAKRGIEFLEDSGIELPIISVLQF